jgi:leucyl-tRNA synthetase
MEYNFRKIEKDWQQKWKETNAYKVNNPDSFLNSKPKCYVLDMFPYPSGAGLHVGHPLGYIASDIYARYKRLKGFNVLHPMGYDSFGLPAEQYALETGQHPAVTTENNINTFRKQLDNIGFCFDWSREIRTSDPNYYKWTQWIFLQLFNSYFCNTEKKALPISKLINKYATKGAMPKSGTPIPGKHFTAEQWNTYTEKEQQDILMNRRLAFLAYGEVNWCEALGTVLANDEVVNGVSERGGHPVVKKKMHQWYLRITAYAERLLQGLETVEFSEAMKEMQKNWIGKSTGAEVEFSLTPNPSPHGEGGERLLSGHFFQTANKKNWNVLKDLSRENRKAKTDGEDILWQELRNNRLGYKVRRQHVIDGFIIDFAFLQKKLLIEIDGGYHDNEEQKRYDVARTEFLKESGYTVLRFTNEEVLSAIEDVLKKIKVELENEQVQRSKTPLSERRGAGGEALKLKVYTTRPDTIFGVDFMVLAPEHELVQQITTPDQKQEIEKYLEYVKSRSERERLAEVKSITGAFTGAYAINPLSGREIPIWISEYVLAGYGTGAIMAVPCGDQRDFNFAKHFNIPITNIIGEFYNGEEANPTKDAILTNSAYLNGMLMEDAFENVVNELEDLDCGKVKVNYKMRDAGFSRQRYWGEPFPIVYKNGIAYPVDEKELPVELPHVENYKPGPEGEGPLANITEWVNLNDGDKRETNTMPGYAGSSWYFLRYMDPHNDEVFADKKITDYWNQVDVYVGGTEHAVGHLLYSRMWTKVLFDLGFISFDEPFRKLVNQGMIQGSSRFVYQVIVKHRADENSNLPLKISLFVSQKQYLGFKNSFLSFLDIQNEINKNSTNIQWGLDKLPEKYINNIIPIHVDVNLVDGLELNIDEFRKWKPEYKNSIFLTEDGTISDPDVSNQFGKYICGVETEKMSKSKYNTVNPDVLIEKYGADTFRMYEMFLGPVEQSKPWDTKGIEGVHRFLKKLWRLFFDDVKGKVWSEEKATDAELKVLHKTIKKIEEDTERFSYNTAVSAFMVCVNELHDLKCYKKEILQQLLILLNPYAPHISAELWHQMGNEESILDTSFPTFNSKYLIESSKEYPISINGKMRTTINISLDATQDDVQKIVLENEVIKKWIEDKPIKKLIYVKNKMVNVVV